MKKNNITNKNKRNNPQRYIIDSATSEKQKIALQDRNLDLIWDPIFECFIEKQEGHEYVLEKGTVQLHVK